MKRGTSCYCFERFGVSLSRFFQCLYNIHVKRSYNKKLKHFITALLCFYRRKPFRSAKGDPKAYFCWKVKVELATLAPIA